MENDFHTYITACCEDCLQTWKIPLACPNRFCEICHGSQRKRARDRMRAVINKVAFPLNYQLKMFTLTIQSQGQLCRMVHSLVDYFKILRKSKTWKHFVLGGFYVIEMTKSSKGWHAHLHILALSLYYPYKLLLKQWNDITGATGVFIQNVPKETAVVYVTKYVTKTSLNDYDQLEASMALKGRRLYQAFGCFHAVNVQVPKAKFICPFCQSDSCVIIEHELRRSKYLNSS